MNNLLNTSPEFDFANILFSGNCNAKCPFCIGKELSTYSSNLDIFPIKNLDVFLELIKKYSISEVTFTGTNTDPQLYRHERKLIDTIKGELPESKLSIHTNGFLILKKIDEFNMYNKATISLPSFNEKIFQIMMGTKLKVPNMKTISESSDIPIKISRIVNSINNSPDETSHFLDTLLESNISRVVFRKLFGDMTSWKDTIVSLEKYGAIRTGNYRGNPIYTIGNVEITLWSFDNTESKSINLFSDGNISDRYLLSEAKK